jgi:hypothetical protein
VKTSHVRTFVLRRLEDETGTSGVGVVAEGAQFATGVCALSWLTDVTSVGIYPSLKALKEIHGHGGKTVLEFTTLVSDFAEA